MKLSCGQSATALTRSRGLWYGRVPARQPCIEGSLLNNATFKLEEGRFAAPCAHSQSVTGATPTFESQVIRVL